MCALDMIVTDAAHPTIWLRPERSGRGPAPEYSRAQIARAGVELADADGLTSVTMRSVAAAVGAGPASLYRYVATRDELVEPNAVTYLERALATLREIDVSGQVKLEAIGMFSGVVRLLASQEISQQLARQSTRESESSLAQYLMQVVAAGQHPHLAAALAARPDKTEVSEPEALFDRTLTRVLTGLVQPLSFHEGQR